MAEYARFSLDTMGKNNCLLLIDITIHQQSNKFATGVDNWAKGDSKLNGSPAIKEIINKGYTIY